MDIYIKDGKIWDICTLQYKGSKRDENISDSEYIETQEKDLFIGDTWDFEKSISLKNSPQRFIKPEPTKLELLQEKYNELELRLKKLEEK